jgi:hypothetical protein
MNSKTARTSQGRLLTSAQTPLNLDAHSNAMIEDLEGRGLRAVVMLLHFSVIDAAKDVRP